MTRSFAFLSPFNCATLVSLLFPGVGSSQTPEKVDFEKSIKPIFQKHCVFLSWSFQTQGWFGFDPGFPGDARGNSGPLLVPHDPSKSLLYRAVAGLEPGLEMLPRDRPWPVRRLMPCPSGSAWAHPGPDSPIKTEPIPAVLGLSTSSLAFSTPKPPPGNASHRCVSLKRSFRSRPGFCPGNGSANPASAPYLRFDRIASDTRGDGGFFNRPATWSLRKTGRAIAGISRPSRTVGAPLAGPGALR